jgi:selenoprotein W-related protein
MTTVDIEYCVPCGHLERAQQTQAHLLETFGRDVDGVRLIPGDGGIFEVRVDGDLAYDASETGYDLEAITETVRERATA